MKGWGREGVVSLSLSTNNDSTFTSGRIITDSFIHYCLSIDWHPIWAVQLIKALATTPTLSTQQRENILSIAIECLHSIPLHSLPTTIYHLLLLAPNQSKIHCITGIAKLWLNDGLYSDIDDERGERGNSILRESIPIESSIQRESIQKDIIQKDSSIPRESSIQRENDNQNRNTQLERIKGSIIMMVSHGCKQDVSLGDQLLHAYKESPLLLTSEFHLGLALAIASIQRYSEKTIMLLKSLLVQSFSDSIKNNQQKCFPFLRNLYTHLLDVLISMSDKTDKGWYTILSSLSELAFTLLETEITSVSAFGSTLLTRLLSSTQNGIQ